MIEKLNVEDVFISTGTPTYTYVQPQEYLKLIVAVRSKGKCVVVEGPSGIGKTTAINKVIDELKLKFNLYSARNKNDIEKIKEISKGNFSGGVIIDDFHRLSDSVREDTADVMKYLADVSDETRKIIIIGINRVGDSLVQFSPDLNNRIATIRFETNSAEKIEELIRLGEKHLNIRFDDISQLIEHSYGSFHIAQLLCQKACLVNKIIQTQDKITAAHVSYPNILSEMMDEFSRAYFGTAKMYATGPKLRREGRAPYLHTLKWLSESDSWAITLNTEISKHPAQKAGVTQIVEKGYLKKFLNNHEELTSLIHFDDITSILTVEDPKFMFYLKGLNWNSFAASIGYTQLVSEYKYDYALSFAGADRRIAEKIFQRLAALEIAVFYDKNEQAEILSKDVEEYLYPIYNSEARYVIPLLSVDYPNRVWTRFESKAFKSRFGENAVIPIWYSNIPDNTFDASKSYGGITFYPENENNSIDEIVSVLRKKIVTAN